MTVFLDVEDLLAIAEAASGSRPTLRDIGLLASAATRPQATAFGADAYPDLFAKAAALLHSITRNHALVDGNKRLAWAATAVFLDLNGYRIHATQTDVVELVVAIAEGTLDDISEIAERLQHLGR